MYPPTRTETVLLVILPIIAFGTFTAIVLTYLSNSRRNLLSTAFSGGLIGLVGGGIGYVASEMLNLQIIKYTYGNSIDRFITYALVASLGAAAVFITTRLAGFSMGGTTTAPQAGGASSGKASSSVSTASTPQTASSSQAVQATQPVRAVGVAQSQPPDLAQVRTSNNPSLRLFISYRRTDSAEITGRICDKLINRFGYDAIFKDVDSIPFGVDFREFLNEEVGKCNALIAVIGPEWLDATHESGKRRLDDPADFVRIEIAAALSRNILVVPLLVSEASMPREDELPADLKLFAYRNASQARNDPDFHGDMDRLIKSLEKTLLNRR